MARDWHKPNPRVFPVSETQLSPSMVRESIGQQSQQVTSPPQEGAEFDLIMGRRVIVDGGSFIFGSRM